MWRLNIRHLDPRIEEYYNKIKGKMEQLKEKLKSNDQLMSELVEENIGLKKI